jgi:hypothetical protein
MLDVAAWQNFAVMTGGGSAALTGLLFVSVSLNRDQIVQSVTLRSSAGQTLLLLIIPFVLCALLLIPDQRRSALTTELIVFALASAYVFTRLHQRRTRAHVNQEAPDLAETSRIANIVGRRATSLATTALILIGAATYGIGHGGGLYWLVAAMILALISGVLNAWFFLVGVSG